MAAGLPAVMGALRSPVVQAGTGSFVTYTTQETLLHSFVCLFALFCFWHQRLNSQPYTCQAGVHTAELHHRPFSGDSSTTALPHF